MKILRIIARLNVGGPARHVIWLTSGLNDEEFNSSLIAGSVPEGEEDMGYLAADAGVEPYYVREMSRELSPKDAVSLVKVYREMLRVRPDVIHTHTAKAGTIGRVAALAYKYLTVGTLIGRPRKIRIVHTFHGHVFHSYYGPVKTKFFILIERMLAKFATDRIITITQQQFREINQEHKVGRSDQFEIIPLGIDLGLFQEAVPGPQAFRSEADIADTDLLVGFVGRLTEIKNLSMFLRVAKLVSEASADVPPRIRFIIVGDGHLRDSLELEAAELQLGDTVIFVGNRNDIANVYAGLDIVVLTSRNEGTPLSLIEAMASGKPVISTRVGGVSDLLGETRTSIEGFDICERGIAVPSGSEEIFAKGLIYLAKDEKLREALGQNGRSFVHSNYSKQRLISDIKELYRKLAA